MSRLPLQLRKFNHISERSKKFEKNTMSTSKKFEDLDYIIKAIIFIHSREDKSLNDIRILLRANKRLWFVGSSTQSWCPPRHICKKKDLMIQHKFCTKLKKIQIWQIFYGFCNLTLYISSFKKFRSGRTRRIPWLFETPPKECVHIEKIWVVKGMPASPSTPLLRDSLRTNNSACIVPQQSIYIYIYIMAFVTSL